MLQRGAILISLIILSILVPSSITAQSDLAAIITVQNAGVEIQRAETDTWIPVSEEAIANVGDTIRTDDDGRALVTFFDDGIDTDIEPNTTYRIDTFNGDAQTYDLSVSLLVGQTRQRIGRALDAGSSYEVEAPGITLVARGTIFDVRVEENGRTTLLVSEGTVSAENDDESVDVTVGFGIRAPLDGELSDIIPANTFDELDDTLDSESVSKGPGTFDTQVLRRPMFISPLYLGVRGAGNSSTGINSPGGTNNGNNGNRPDFNSINPAGNPNMGGNGVGNGNDGTNGGGNGNSGGGRGR